MHLFKYNLIYSVKFTVFADFVYFARKYEDLLLKKLPNLNSTYDNFFSSKNPSSLRLRYIFTSINFSQNFERIVEQTSTSQSRDIFNLNFRIDLWFRETHFQIWKYRLIVRCTIRANVRKSFEGIVKKFRSCEIASASPRKHLIPGSEGRVKGDEQGEAGRVPFGRERRGPVCRSDAAVMSTNIYLIGSAAARRRTLPLCYAGAISILSLRPLLPLPLTPPLLLTQYYLRTCLSVRWQSDRL